MIENILRFDLEFVSSQVAFEKTLDFYYIFLCPCLSEEQNSSYFFSLYFYSEDLIRQCTNEGLSSI